MKRMIVFLIMAVIFSSTLSAQDAGVLPDDPRIIKGKMENGLEYYVVNNPVRKGYADFYLVEKIGTTVESDSQSGMTALISNLALKNTRNFPNGDLFTFIDDMGLSVQRDYQVGIGSDECFFKLANVPLSKNPDILDSALLVLFNFSSGINIFEETLPAGKEFAINSLAGEMTYAKRINSKFCTLLFPDSPYDMENPQEIIRRMGSYSARELRDFYREWCRPDLQALIVVGDVKPDEVKSKIRTLFQAASKRSDMPERVYADVELPKGPSFVCVTDGEAAYADVAMTMVSDALPDELRVTAIPLVEDFLNYMMVSVMNWRFSSGKDTLPFPVFSANASYGSFLDVRNQEGLRLEVRTDPSRSSDGLGFIVSEVERIRRDGISVSEFERARDAYLKRVQYLYDWRANIPNSIYADRCFSNYTGDYSLASVEELKKYINKTGKTLMLDQFERYVHSFFDDTVHRVVTCVTSPANGDGLKENLANAYAQAMVTSLPVFADTVMTSALDTLEDKSIRPGKIVSKMVEPITKATLWTLSNGAQVLVKSVKTEPERISFRAIAKGGLSLYSGNAGALRKYINDITLLSNPSDTIIRRDVSEALTTLSCKFPSNDLKEIVPYIYLNFKPIAPNDRMYGKYMKEKEFQAANMNNSPEDVFAGMLGNSIIATGKSEEPVDYHSAVSFVNRLYSNPADFTFMFVGDVDERALESLVCKYIASIPGNARLKSAWKSGPFISEKYNKTDERHMKMEFPRYYHDLRLSFDVPFDVENVALAEVVSGIIKRRVVNKLFNSGVYAYPKMEMRKYPSEMMILDFIYISANSSSEIEEVFSDVLSDLASNGVSESEASAAKSAVTTQDMVSEKVSTEFWVDILTGRFIYGKDFYTTRKNAVESLSLEEINEGIRDAVNTGHKMFYKLFPEE